MIVDANAFFGEWPYWRLPTPATEQGLFSWLDRLGVEAAALSSTKAVLLDGRSGNAEVLALAGRHPGRLVAIATVNPAAGAAAVEDVELSLAGGARGLRLAPAFHGYRPVPSPVLNAVLERAREAGVPVLLNFRLLMNWGFPHLPATEAMPLIERFRDVRFVLAGVNRVDFGAALDLASLGDIYLETSCLQEFGAVAAAVARLGADRVLLGTGAPMQYPSCGLAKVAHARLDEEARAQVLGGNAARLFGVPADAAGVV